MRVELQIRHLQEAFTMKSWAMKQFGLISRLSPREDRYWPGGYVRLLMQGLK